MTMPFLAPAADSLAETREFPTAVVLSAVADVLVCEFSAMHEAIEWMANGPVWTHQLPRVSREIAAAMIAARPELALAVEEAEGVNRDNWREHLARWIDRYGPTMTVSRMTVAKKDPIAELREMAPDKPIIVVAPECR